MYKILVTGASGQLGSELQAIAGQYDYVFHFKDSKELDITNYELFEQFVVDQNINVIINCAAYTAVDEAESESELAEAINYLAVEHMAEVAKVHQIKLVHISTDYVFDGRNHEPYIETDATNPQSVYGQTKLDGELAMQKVSPSDSLIIRTSWVYSQFGNNFVKTMLNCAEKRDEISVVADQIGSPTNAADLAEVILVILPKIKSEVVEVYHYSNDGECSWYEFAINIFKKKNLKIKVHPIKSKDFKTRATRPLYSKLNNKKIKKRFSLDIKSWKESLGCFQR
ncbi:dTDP-4-dehydrorhamnose reductase [bacterium]|nr:dTDP-4-dehydrorhamnose reductase [bacterium]